MDKLFGLSEKALQVTEDRAVLLSTNIVNSETPNYKAKDIDFYKVMNGLDNSQPLETTSSAHIQREDMVGGSEVKFRIPMQFSMDGNTVDPEIERKNFLENSLRYQVNLSFIQNKADQIMKAIKGD